MEQLMIGEIIRETRIRLGYVQEDLCIGDLDVKTVSRIENGEHIPQNSVIKKIFAQMNMRIPINLVSVTDEEFNKYQLQTIIENKLEAECTDFGNLAEEFKNCMMEMDEFDWQIYYLINGICKKKDKDYQVAKEFFCKAIKETMQSFSESYDLDKRRRVTEKELRCLFELTDTEYEIENYKLVGSYLKFMDFYTKCGIMNEHFRIKMRIQVLLFLCRFEEKRKKINRVLEYSDEGIKFCIDKDSLFHLSDFFYFNSRAFAYNGNYQEAKKSLSICFILLEGMNMNEELSCLKNKMKQDFDIEIDW